YNKTFETVVKKLGNKSFTSLTSSFTNDSIENRNINNGGGDDDDDDHDDDDDEEHNNGINDINNFDYNNVEVEADNDFAMEEKDKEDMSIDETSLESSGNTTLLTNNNSNNSKKRNKLINANKIYMNKIEKRINKIEEYIFKWIGVEQLQEKYDTQSNSMRGCLTKLQTTLTSGLTKMSN
uniref:Uncharacterized protein n=1 Tax=Glossina palpalis gambiensis TaxID=67801 RepID=A0A1B0B559_9MUSC